MTRWNGSLIGVQKNTSLTDSTGVWNLRRQTLAKQNAVWPLDNSTIPQPNWSLDFSSGSPWSGGVEYTYTSSRTDGSATFINTSGQIKPIGLNLAPNTNNWSQNVTNFSGVTATANYAVSPSGETDATRAQVTTTGFVYKGAQGAVSSGTYTLSFYIKATSNPENVFVRVVGDNVTKTTQTITTTSSWVRYSYTITTTTAAGLEIGIDHRTSVGGPGTTCDILLWGAQVVRGSETLPYRHCPGTTNEAIPRLTHDRNGSRLGLLVEGQRTNHVTQSNDFNTSWTVANLSRTASATTSPDGLNNGWRLVENNTNSQKVLYQSVVNQSNAVASVYAKADQRTTIALRIYQNINEWIQCTFNLSAGTAGTVQAGSSSPFTSTGARITAAGNGWYRCELRGARTLTATTFISVDMTSSANPTLDSGNGVEAYTGNGTNGVFVFGAQLEGTNSAATSYIPTTTASVTSNEDKVHITKSKITNWSSPGAVCVHFYKPLQAGTLVATDNAATEKLGIQASSTTAARAFWSNGQTATGDIGEPVFQKAIHYWDGTTSKFCINGTTVQTGTNNVSNFNNTNFITLGAEATDSSGSPGTFSNYANCVIRKVEFYAGSLTDTNLQEITNIGNYTSQYVVVAGGAGGGYGGGGGGGAGGYLESSSYLLVPGLTYSVTVGSGGVGGTADPGTGSATNGNNSSFGSISAIGGGFGGRTIGNGGSGGSGGGSGGWGNGATTAGNGTAGQGNAGGNNGFPNTNGSPWAGGGGGGAGSAGTAPPVTGTGGSGGNGLSSSITGTSVTRAGGGGGAPSAAGGSVGAAGSGGGGSGATGSIAPGAGSANTGGGGGAGAGVTNLNGAAGGSGVVIIRVPTSNYSGVYTGTPNISQVGDDTVLVFNSSGSYRA
jgi:hypothetical protein